MSDDPNKPVKVPPVPKPPDLTPKKTVWIACRATKGCTGKTCIEQSHKKTPLGGHITSYKCTVCNRGFVIQI